MDSFIDLSVAGVSNFFLIMIWKDMEGIYKIAYNIHDIMISYMFLQYELTMQSKSITLKLTSIMLT